MNQQVSVVMCTYNGALFLKEQLISIINQTYPIFELIIQDDGSIDETSFICTELIKEYSFISFHRNEKKLGITSNFFEGIRKAKGDYIVLADQDDIWRKDKIERLMCYSSRYAVVHSDVRLIDEKGNVFIHSHFQSNKISERMPLKKYINGENNVIGCTMLFSACLKEYIYPYCQNLYLHDHWISIVAYRHGGIHFIKETLVDYRQHQNNAVGAFNSPKMTLSSYRKKAIFSLFILKNYARIGLTKMEYLYMCYRFLLEVSGMGLVKYRVAHRINQFKWIKKYQ